MTTSQEEGPRCQDTKQTSHGESFEWKLDFTLFWTFIKTDYDYHESLPVRRAREHVALILGRVKVIV
jgi:hypothetical protein